LLAARPSPRRVLTTLGASLRDARAAIERTVSSVAVGLQQEAKAMRDVLATPRDNGQRDGRITKLTLPTRDMRGRAKFDLLGCRRVLLAAWTHRLRESRRSGAASIGDQSAVPVQKSAAGAQKRLASVGALLAE
jgi:hypothetical protein